MNAGQSHNLPSLSASDERQMITDSNNTRRVYPDDKCVHQLFEAQVEQTPDAVAVQFEDRQLTYLELNQRANQLAAHLRDLAVSRRTLVGICTDRSLEMLIGILGILKAGSAYVPLPLLIVVHNKAAVDLLSSFRSASISSKALSLGGATALRFSQTTFIEITTLSLFLSLLNISPILFIHPYFLFSSLCPSSDPRSSSI